jgi:hypothetical protein
MADIPIPKRRTCGQMQVHQRLLESVPNFRAAQSRLETQTQRLMSTMRTQAIASATIQTVVHVVYNTDSQNIPKSQVDSQIDALNRDFGRRNEDIAHVPEVWAGLPVDTRIRFALASADPDGAPTDGVTRTRTEREWFGSNDDVKRAADGGCDPWPTNRYLNIWVCPLGESLLGYAQFPGGPSATDGVVILYRAFGTTGAASAPFDGGRTAVHEVGHWLNLRHIWGDTEDCSGSDNVSDTPRQQLPNYDKPTFPHVSCNNGPNGDMFMNYMDYVDDAAMVMFTPGQSARMWATLLGPRRSLI